MKTLVLFLALTLQSFSADISATYGGEINAVFGTYVDDTSEGKFKDNDAMIDATLYLDIEGDNWIATISPGYMSIPSRVSHTLNAEMEKQEFLYINELSLSYSIDTWMLTAGAISFRQGTFYEYSNGGDHEGNGLFTLIDQVLNGAMLTKKFSDEIYITGGYFSKDSPVSSRFEDKEVYTTVAGRDYDFTGSEGSFMLAKWKDDNNELEFNYWHYDSYVNDDLITTNQLYGIGYSHLFDETDITLYGIAAYSHTTGDSTPLSPYPGVSFTTDSYHFDKIDQKGYSMLLGVNKMEYFKSIGKEITFNAEWNGITAGFHSINLGLMGSDYAYGTYGDTFRLSASLMWYENLIITARVKYYKSSGEDLKSGGLAEFGTTKDMNAGVYPDKAKAATINIQYRF